MAFFRSYFDESGKFNDHRVISFCGVMASPESRGTFNDAWDALLRKNQLTSFHTTKALQYRRSLSPSIRKGSAGDRCESLKPFVDCILDNLDLGVIIAVDVDGYSKWSAAAKRKVGGSDDPAYLAFLQAMGAVKKYASREADRVSIMCDDDEQTAQNFYRLYRRGKKIDPELKKKLVSISFSDDELFPPLQAADLIAALVRLESLKRFGYHPHDFKPLISHLMAPRAGQKLTWIGFIADSQTLQKIDGSLGNA